VPTQAAKARTAWEQLNERQRAYLRVIYQFDQDAEEEIAAARKRWEKPPPASEWRWQLYAVEGPGNHSSIQAQLKHEGKLDPGAGSTLKVLRTRGLIEERGDFRQVGFGMADVLLVKLTPAGRAAARAGLDEPRPAKAPEGLLSEWLWGALARLYNAGEQGCLTDTDRWDLPKDSPEYGPTWNALLGLRDRKDGELMEDFQAGGKYRYRPSARGRRHAELHHRCYAELYPAVPGIEPDDVDGAHEGLVDHQGKPRHLVKVTEWRLLVWLTDLEQRGRSPERELLARDYTQYDDEVPAAVLDIPDGQISLYGAEKTAGSAAAVERLAARKGGGLVEVVQALNLRRYPGEAKTVPRVQLTEAGRRHVAEHVDEYRRWYPDTDGPQTRSAAPPSH